MVSISLNIAIKPICVFVGIVKDLIFTQITCRKCILYLTLLIFMPIVFKRSHRFVMIFFKHICLQIQFTIGATLARILKIYGISNVFFIKAEQ